MRKQIGQRLRLVREALGYTRKEVERVTNVTYATQANIELNQIEPSFLKVAKLCEFYDISMDSLVFDTNEQFEELLNDLRGVVYEVRSAV